MTGMSFEERQKQVYLDNAEELDALEAASKKRSFVEYTQEVGSGITAGVGNGISDIADTTFEMTNLAGLGLAGYVTELTGREIEDPQKVLDDMNNFTTSLTDYIKSEETDSSVQNFAMNTTESITKFALFYRGLMNAGVKGGAAIAGAGFAEGYTDDPDKELLFVEDGMRAALKSIAPDKLDDFNRAMDPNTGNMEFKRLQRRVMGGLEIGALSLAGDKAVSAVSPALKSGAQAVKGAAIDASERVAKKLPEPFKQATVKGFSQLMEKTRRAKEWMGSGGKETFDNYVSNIKPETNISVKKGAMEAGASAKQNLRNLIEVEYDSTLRIVGADDYKAAIKDYEKQLQTLVPDIEDEIISMAKSRGVAEKEELASFARALGVDETEFLKEQGLKNVLKAQAHNILFENQAANYMVHVGNFNKGVIDEKVLLDAEKSFFQTALQRDSLLTGAGRTLRTAQELPGALTKVAQGVRAARDITNETLTKVGLTIDDDEAFKVMSSKMRDIAQLSNITGDNPEQLLKAMRKGMSAADPKKSGVEFAKEVGDAISATYQANLLSATATLSQNTFGSAAQMFMQANETLITGLQGRVFGRQTGDATMREAFVQYKNMASTHLDALMLTGKVVGQYAKKYTGQGADDLSKLSFKGTFTNTLGDIPEMSAKERASMLRLNKEDMAAQAGSVNEAIDKSTIGRILTGRPVFDVIQLQDTVTKTAAARAYMQGRFDTALYVDDVFGLVGKIDEKKLKQSQKALTSLFKEGRVFGGGKSVTADELAELGLKKSDAAEVSVKLNEWVKATSKEASEYGVEAAMQTPLQGPMKAIQGALQESIPMGRLIVPFFTTPVNILTETIKRAPVIQAGSGSAAGLPIHPGFYADFAAGGARRKAATSRALQGMALFQLGHTLGEMGLLTPVSEDVNERIAYSELMQQPPGNLAIGDQTIPLFMFGAFGNIITLGASKAQFQREVALQDHLEDGERAMIDDAVLSNVVSMYELTKEQPYAVALEQLSGLFEFDLENETQIVQFQEYAGRIAGNLAPYSSFQRQAANLTMEEQKRSHGFWGTAIQQFAPYVNYTAYDPFGVAIPTDGDILTRGKTKQNDPVYNDIFTYSDFVPRKLKFQQTVPGARKGEPNVKITLDEGSWEEYHTILREEIDVRSKLIEAMQTNQFQRNAYFGERKQNGDILRAEHNKARKQALETLLSRRRYLLYDVEEKRKQKLLQQNLQPIVPAGATASTLEFNGGNNGRQ